MKIDDQVSPLLPNGGVAQFKSFEKVKELLKPNLEDQFDLDLCIQEDVKGDIKLTATQNTCAYTCAGPSCANCSVRNVSCNGCTYLRC